ncbi:MAG: GNAT family N-acetyltransferase [Anaerolineae bacterium]|nr:GNAT family N-acetyltransferase [Anaerolineae bacterium]
MTGEKLVVRQATAGDRSRLIYLIEHAQRVRVPRCWPVGLEPRSILLAEEGRQLAGFVSAVVTYPPVSVLQGIGLADPWPVTELLDLLLPPLVHGLRQQGARALVYIGEEPWLIPPLRERTFAVVNRILTYVKDDFVVPSRGNQKVCVRPVQKEDLGTIVALDEAAFDPLWRNTIDVLDEVRRHCPYFVVAELDGRVVGYQFNDLEGERGHLTRIAVHPDVQGQGIGVRLMAEAIDFFLAMDVESITLNTQQDNWPARRLYHWFGFRPLEREALVLWKTL